MRTLKLQLDYVQTTNISQSDVAKLGAVWDVASGSDHHPVLLSSRTRPHKNRRIPPRSKFEMAGLKDIEGGKEFRQRESVHVRERTNKKPCDADSFTECRRNVPSLPRIQETIEELHCCVLCIRSWSKSSWTGLSNIAKKQRLANWLSFWPKED